MRELKIFTAVLILAGFSLHALGEDEVILVDDLAGTETPAMSEPEPEIVTYEEFVSDDPGWGHRILWYIPNRLLDLIDIVRFRARVGPGVAVSVQMTDNANLYAGQYKSVYVGLPGPRREVSLPHPVGFEQEKGLMFMGVDATDDLPNEPGYSSTEFDLGLHVLIVGAEAGFDPVEFWDFLTGFVFIDPVGDDR